jgi:hypothetical protein
MHSPSKQLYSPKEWGDHKLHPDDDYAFEFESRGTPTSVPKGEITGKRQTDGGTRNNFHKMGLSPGKRQESITESGKKRDGNMPTVLGDCSPKDKRSVMSPGKKTGVYTPHTCVCDESSSK